MCDLSASHAWLAGEIANTPMPPEYADWTVGILCNDCQSKEVRAGRYTGWCVGGRGWHGACRLALSVTCSTPASEPSRTYHHHIPPHTIHHPPSTIHHPPSTIHHPPSTIYHPHTLSNAFAGCLSHSITHRPDTAVPDRPSLPLPRSPAPIADRRIPRDRAPLQLRLVQHLGAQRALPTSHPGTTHSRLT